MKIYANQLSLELKKGLCPFYLISGDIPTLSQETLKTIHKEAEKHGFSQTLRYQTDHEFDWEQFKNSWAHYSLFQQKQIIELHTANFHWGERATEILNECLNRPQPDKLFILTTPKLDAKTQKASWVKQITEKGTYITIWPLDFGKYLQWVQAKLQEKGLSSNHEGIRLIAQYTEGHYASAIQTIEKLSLAYPCGNITLDQIADSTFQTCQFSLFEWVDECLAGDTARMLKIFKSLQDEGTEPSLMLWIFTQEIRKLIRLHISRQTELTLSQAFKQEGIWEKKQPAFEKALNRHPLGSLELLLQKAHETDKILKGAKLGNIWDELMSLGLMLLGKTRHP